MPESPVDERHRDGKRPGFGADLSTLFAPEPAELEETGPVSEQRSSDVEPTTDSAQETTGAPTSASASRTPEHDRRPPRDERLGARVRPEDVGAEWPELPDWAVPGELAKDVLRDLRGLSKETSEFVGRHLVAATALADEDPELAWQHARAARSKGGRIAVVRETAGLVAYRAGEWAEAIAELRAARRMGGGPGHVAILADCERALGNPERALEMSRSPEADELDLEAAAELRIVAAGARADLGQVEAALLVLDPSSSPPGLADHTLARIAYAYADLLDRADRKHEALEWFARAADLDEDNDTDAGDRLHDLMETVAAPTQVAATEQVDADDQLSKSAAADADETADESASADSAELEESAPENSVNEPAQPPAAWLGIFREAASGERTAEAHPSAPRGQDE